MNNNFAFNVPINNLSFGQTSVAILREIHRRGLEPCIFPIGGQVDITSQPVNQDFNNWLSACLNSSVRRFKKKFPVFKLWHLNNSLEGFSDKQVLLTFYELDSPTQEEVNVVNNNAVVAFSNSTHVSLFESFGCKNVVKIPLAFDAYNFKQKEPPKFDDNRISFVVVGKVEKRKHHQKLIQAWLKKFGSNSKYFLSCSLFNPFIHPEEQKAIFNQIVMGRRWGNIEFYDNMPLNEQFNNFLNAQDIVIGMSGGEGWGLPEFQSVALGKHAVILNASGYKEWANAENSVLVNPSGKEEVYDGKFFAKGFPFNQGSIFSWNEDEFIDACEQAIKRVKANRINTAGLELQKKYTIEKTTDLILNELEKLQ